MKDEEKKKASLVGVCDTNSSPLLSPVPRDQHQDKTSLSIYSEDIGTRTSFGIKIVQTFVLFYAFVAMGISGAIVGPTLMDIEKLTNTNTETVAWIMTARCLGGVLGVFIMGAIFTKGNPWLLMGIANFIAGIMLMVTPLFRNIIVMCVFYIIHGAGRWFVDGGCNVMILAVWGLANGPWMQGLHCSAGIGSLLAPVVASPFLSSKHHNYDEEEIFSNGTLKVYLSDRTSDNANISSMYLGKTEEATDEKPGHSNAIDEKIGSSLFLAYFIVSMAVVLSAIAFMTLFFLRTRYKGIKRTSLHDDRKQKSADPIDKRHITSEKPDSKFCSSNICNMSPERFYHLKMLLLVAFFDVIQCLVTINYGNFVFTFAVKYLNWSKRQAVMVTSTYWGAFTGARVLAIFLSKFLHPRNLLLLCLLIGLISSAVLLFFAKYHFIVLWLCTIGYGFAMSPLFATSVSLLGRFIRVSSPEGATLVMSTIIGEMAGPVLVGLLFNKFGPISLVYVMVTVQCILLVLSAIIYFTGKNKSYAIAEEMSVSATEEAQPHRNLKSAAV